MADNDAVRIIYGPPPPTADPADRFVSLDEAFAGLPEAMEAAVLKALGAGGVMSDEWSKPVKDEDGDWRSETVGAPMGHYHDALLRDGYIGEGMDRTTAIPAHVALRLLAAEASDRLGWVWRPYQMPPGPLHMCCEIGEWWFDNGTSGAGTPVEATPTFRFGLVKSSVHGGMPFPTPDELLALHHGRFLLEDALREAGR